MIEPDQAAAIIAACALSGVSVPPDRAQAIAAELVRLAAAPMQPALEDEPADFIRLRR